MYEFDTPEYNALLQNNRRPGSRAVIMIKVHKTSTVSNLSLVTCGLTSFSQSCGYAVPFFNYRAERTKLDEFSMKKEANDNGVLASSSEKQASNGLKAYWIKHGESIDGLPGIQTAFKTARRFDEYTVPADFQPTLTQDVAPTIAEPINLKAEKLRPLTKTMITTILAFGAGVVLSAQVHNIIEHVGSFVP